MVLKGEGLGDLQGIKGVFGQEGGSFWVETEKEAVVDWLPWVWSVAHHLNDDPLSNWELYQQYLVFMVKKPHMGYQLVERHFLGEKIMLSEEAA